MKKRLLITSIVMMLVVAVALGTSTYAWFTSNTTVTANQVLLTASTMSGDAIMISRNANNTGLSNAITLTAQGTDRLYPATPLASTAFTSAVSEETFKNLLVDGTNTAKEEALTGDAHANDKSFYTDTFYVYNKGFNAVTLAATVSISYDLGGAASDAAHSMRIALIEEVGTWNGTALNFGSASLKNIYEIGTVSAVKETTNPSSFEAGAVYVDSNGDSVAVTSDTFSSLQSTIYKVTGYTATTTSALGSSTAGSGYGVVSAANSSFTQGGVEFSTTDMSAIAAPASGTYVANKYTVVVWYEGWDAECTNAMSAGAARVGLSFQKATPPAQQGD